jgi:hypothetical protein
MSSSLLWRTQVAVLPAVRNGLHRVGAYLRLMDKAAFDASQCPVLETGTSCGNALDLRARLAIWDNEAAQGDRVCESGNDASGGVRRKRRQTLSVADGCRWPGGDRGSMPTWHYDSMVNIAHPQRFDVAASYRRWRNACGYRTLAQLEVADATLLLRYQRRSSKAEAGEHSGLVHSDSCTVVRYYVAKYTVSAAETWARGKGATEAEIEAARRCLKAIPMQTVTITTPAQGRE